MTIEQYCELLKYIKENNSWSGNMYENGYMRRRILIKYVRASFDTRDDTIFLIQLEPGDGSKKSFRVDYENGIKDVYAFLDKRLSRGETIE